MRSILAVTDLTPEAEPALRLAARVAQNAGAALHVVHAMGLIGLTLREAFEPLRGGLIPRAQAALDEQVQRTVSQLSGLKSYTLDPQNLLRAVATCCAREAVDLVVLADRRAGTGPERRMAAAVELGTVAAVPILVPSADACWPPARIRCVSPHAEMGAVEEWLGRLAPLASVVGEIDTPRGWEPGAVGAVHGELDLLVARAAEAGSVQRWIEEPANRPGLDEVSILWLPVAEPALGGLGADGSPPIPQDAGAPGEARRQGARATIEACATIPGGRDDCGVERSPVPGARPPGR